jgi:hypothetical protein
MVSQIGCNPNNDNSQDYFYLITLSITSLLTFMITFWLAYLVSYLITHF